MSSTIRIERPDSFVIDMRRDSTGFVGADDNVLNLRDLYDRGALGIMAKAPKVPPPRHFRTKNPIRIINLFALIYLKEIGEELS
jgi:hypothetical protein